MADRKTKLEAQNERFREVLELIADIDVKPFRCAAIARDALAEEDRTSQEELDEMVASSIEAAMETSPEFNHSWRSVPEKDVIPEILDEIPAEYCEQEIAEAIYRYKVRRLLGEATPSQP